MQVASDGIFDVLRDMFGSSARGDDIEEGIEEQEDGVPSFREQLRKARERR